jgi:hypothetical protein
MLREQLPADEIRACAANHMPPARVDVLVPAMTLSPLWIGGGSPLGCER